MIFVDSNIPMYLVGASDELRLQAQRLLEDCIGRGARLVTDAEVFQEILHRYVAIRRPDAIQPAFEALRSVVDEVLPIGLADVERAKEIVFSVAQLSARDAVHAATIERHRVEEILSFDTGFDLLPGVRRIS